MFRKLFTSSVMMMACCALHAAPIPPAPTGNFVNNSAAAQIAQFNVGTGTVRGTLTVGALTSNSLSISTANATQFVGGGNGLTNLNASQILSGTIPATVVWHGAKVAPLYGGTGQDWSAIAQGRIPYFSATGTLGTVAAGVASQVLQSGGPAGAPSFTGAPSVLGTNITAIPVSALSAGTLAVGVVASSITVTGVTPGTYGGPIQSAQVTVQSDGRISSITQLPIPAVSSTTVLYDGIYTWPFRQTFQSRISIQKPVGSYTTRIADSFLNLGYGTPQVDSQYNIGFGYTGSGTVYPAAYIGYKETDSSGSTMGKFIFAVRSITADLTPLERMTIMPGGRVGINNSAPSSQLDVGGGISAAGSIISSGTYIRGNSFIGDGSALTGIPNTKTLLDTNTISVSTSIVNWTVSCDTNTYTYCLLNADVHISTASPATFDAAYLAVNNTGCSNMGSAMWRLAYAAQSVNASLSGDIEIRAKGSAAYFVPKSPLYVATVNGAYSASILPEEPPAVMVAAQSSITQIEFCIPTHQDQILDGSVFKLYGVK